MLKNRTLGVAAALVVGVAGCGSTVAGESEGGSSSSTGAGSSSTSETASGSSSSSGVDESSTGGSSSSGGEDSSSTSEGTSSSTSGGESSSSTGEADALCGDGIAAAGEFCYETVAIDIAATGDRGIALVDFNDDGRVDFVTGTYVVEATDDGYVASDPLPGGPFIAAGQLDDDPGVEVAIPDGDMLEIHHLTAEGTVASVDAYPFGGTSGYAAIVGQFTGGEESDVAVVGLNAGSVSLYEHTPEGVTPLTALASISFGGSGARHVELADFDDDGNNDLVVAHDSASLSVFMGTGGGFAAAATMNTSSLYTTITVGDANDDGLPDVIGSAASGGFAELHYSDGAGGASGSQIVPLPVGPRAVGVGDFNNDGIADLVAVDYEDTTDLVILFGEGDQNFAEPEVVPFPTWAHDLAVADVNDDGVDDVVVYGADIAVLRSTL